MKMDELSMPSNVWDIPELSVFIHLSNTEEDLRNHLSCGFPNSLLFFNIKCVRLVLIFFKFQYILWFFVFYLVNIFDTLQTVMEESAF